MSSKRKIVKYKILSECDLWAKQAVMKLFPVDGCQQYDSKRLLHSISVS
jgi:hypothetical protein